jgi:hypothetical protein
MKNGTIPRRGAKVIVALPTISQFGSICVLLFIGLSFVGRFLFPFGDEPDFEVRSLGVVSSDDHPWWSPYAIFHKIYAGFDRNGICEIQSTPFSLWAHIPGACGEDLQQILSRFALTVLVALPLMAVLVFPKFFVSIIDPKCRRLTPGEWTLRLDAVALTLLLPSVVMSLGVFAEEQLVVGLSLLLLLTLPRPICVALLLFLIFSLDMGNGVVVLTAVLATMANRFIARKFGWRTLLAVVAAQLAVVLVVGFIFIDVFSSVGFLADKVSGMVSVLSDGDGQAEKYPVIFRPVITFMTAVFMTSESVKVIPLYLVFGTVAWTGAARFRRLEHSMVESPYGFFRRRGVAGFDECRLLLLTAIHVVLLFVFLLPTYSNAKYYLFLLPFIVVSALQVYSRNTIRLLFVSSSVAVFVFLVFYRLH